MTEPTWTPWLENPGTGENPVPEFAVEFKVMLSGNNDTYVNGCWNWSSTPEDAMPITCYRYAIPADLVALVKNVTEWRKPWHYVAWSGRHGLLTYMEGEIPATFDTYTRDQWLRARQDLGYESGIEKFWRVCVGEKVEAKNDNPLTPSKYHRQIKGVYVDVYDILHAFEITNPGDQHAIKKMLQPGKRGYKDARQDREEAIMSLERANELEADQ